MAQNNGSHSIFPIHLRPDSQEILHNYEQSAASIASVGVIVVVSIRYCKECY